MQPERAHFFGRVNGGRGVGWLRRLSLFLAVLMAFTMSEIPARPAGANPPVPAPAPACPADRANTASAAVAAKLCGGPVEALDRRTETAQVFINADGTVT